MAAPVKNYTCAGCGTTALGQGTRRQVAVMRGGMQLRENRDYHNPPATWGIRAWGAGAGITAFCPACSSKVTAGQLVVDDTTGAAKMREEG